MKRCGWLIGLGLLMLLAGCREEGIPSDLALTLHSEGGLSRVAWEETALRVEGEAVVWTVRTQPISGEATLKEGRSDLASGAELYDTLEENGIWELTDSRAAMITDFPTVRVEITAGDRRHSFEVYAPSFDPDPRYRAVVGAVRTFVGGD